MLPGLVSARVAVAAMTIIPHLWCTIYLSLTGLWIGSPPWAHVSTKAAVGSLARQSMITQHWEAASVLQACYDAKALCASGQGHTGTSDQNMGTQASVLKQALQRVWSWGLYITCACWEAVSTLDFFTMEAASYGPVLFPDSFSAGTHLIWSRLLHITGSALTYHFSPPAAPAGHPDQWKHDLPEQTYACVTGPRRRGQEVASAQFARFLTEHFLVIMWYGGLSCSSCLDHCCTSALDSGQYQSPSNQSARWTRVCCVSGLFGKMTIFFEDTQRGGALTSSLSLSAAWQSMSCLAVVNASEAASLRRSAGLRPSCKPKYPFGQNKIGLSAADMLPRLLHRCSHYFAFELVSSLLLPLVSACAVPLQLPILDTATVRAGQHRARFPCSVWVDFEGSNVRSSWQQIRRLGQCSVPVSHLSRSMLYEYLVPAYCSKSPQCTVSILPQGVAFLQLRECVLSSCNASLCHRLPRVKRGVTSIQPIHLTLKLSTWIEHMVAMQPLHITITEGASPFVVPIVVRACAMIHLESSHKVPDKACQNKRIACTCRRCQDDAERLRCEAMSCKVGDRPEQHGLVALAMGFQSMGSGGMGEWGSGGMGGVGSKPSSGPSPTPILDDFQLFSSKIKLFCFGTRAPCWLLRLERRRMLHDDSAFHASSYTRMCRQLDVQLQPDVQLLSCFACVCVSASQGLEVQDGGMTVCNVHQLFFSSLPGLCRRHKVSLGVWSLDGTMPRWKSDAQRAKEARRPSRHERLGLPKPLPAWVVTSSQSGPESDRGMKRTWDWSRDCSWSSESRGERDIGASAMRTSQWSDAGSSASRDRAGLSSTPSSTRPTPPAPPPPPPRSRRFQTSSGGTHAMPRDNKPSPVSSARPAVLPNRISQSGFLFSNKTPEQANGVDAYSSSDQSTSSHVTRPHVRTSLIATQTVATPLAASSETSSSADCTQGY